MKLAIPILIALSLCSCNDHTQTNTEPKKDIPKALKEETSAVELVSSYSKRGQVDIVESLYSELVDSSAELQQLEKDIQLLDKNLTNATSSFDKYNTQNHDYYNSAEGYLSRINDSTLKGRIKQVILNSSAKYASLTARHNDLLAYIQKHNLTLNDMHNVLKIISSMNMMEKYQKENLPSTKPLDDYAKQLDKTINQTEKLTPKY